MDEERSNGRNVSRRGETVRGQRGQRGQGRDELTRRIV